MVHVACLVLAFSGWVAADDAQDPLRVLMLFDEGPQLIALDMVEDGFVETLRAGTTRPVEIYVEYLDTSRFQDTKHHALFADYLKTKYVQARLDVAVPIIGARANWASRVPRDIFPGVPIVFGAALPGGEDSVPSASETTGAFFNIDVVKALETALVVRPGTRRVIVVAGPEEMHAELISRIAAAASEHTGIAFEYWTDRTGAQLLEAAAAIPGDEMIFYLELFRDFSGASYVPYQFGGELAEIASVPVFGIFESYLGTGIVGGEVVGLTKMGDDLARIVLRVVHGESASDIPITNTPIMVPIFDWRAMARWGIEPANLPEGSIVRFRPPPLWQTHRSLIIAAGASIVILVLVGLMFLTRQTLRRRAERAEIDNLRSQMAIAHMSRVSTMSELATSLAHELNQPLAAILSNAQAGLRFLQEKNPDLKEVAEILSDIATDDKRAGETIQRMRDFLRNEPPRPERLNLNAVIDEVLSILRSEAVIQDLSIETDLDLNTPHVRGDRVQLQQVLLNLIINAGQAMKEAGSDPSAVLIRTFKDDGGRACVSVQDTGPGISESKLEDIFAPFYSGKSKGMGMGLAISRSIVEANKGRIWAENAPSGGARFCILLPAGQRA